MAEKISDIIARKAKKIIKAPQEYLTKNRKSIVGGIFLGLNNLAIIAGMSLVSDGISDPEKGISKIVGGFAIGILGLMGDLKFFGEI